MNPDDLPDDLEPEPDEEIEEMTDGLLADLEDLEADLAAAKELTGQRAALALKEARLKKIANSRHPDHELERQRLVASIRKLEEGIVWLTIGNIALFRMQHCDTCGTEHRYFLGWFTEQKHRTDPAGRRLLRGHTIENLPEKIEVHYDGGVELCAACVETCLAINLAVNHEIAA